MKTVLGIVIIGATLGVCGLMILANQMAEKWDFKFDL